MHAQDFLLLFHLSETFVAGMQATLLAWLLQRSAALQASAQQDRLLSTLQDFGDNPLVISGLHENMGSMRFRDTNLRGTAAIASQLCDADQFMTACHRRMDFSMQKYVPTCALAIRSIAAGPERCTQLSSCLFHACRSMQLINMSAMLTLA